MIRLRAARLDDVEAIRRIERLAASRFDAIGMGGQGFDTPSEPQEVAAAIAGGRITVACDGSDAPVGFVEVREVDGEAYIAEIDVLPSHAGRRIGASLIDDAARRAASQGLKAMTLSTFREAPWNAPYYRRLGFEDIGDGDLSPALLEIRAEHQARGLDESRRVFMRRRVSKPG